MSRFRLQPDVSERWLFPPRCGVRPGLDGGDFYQRRSIGPFPQQGWTLSYRGQSCFRSGEAAGSIRRRCITCYGYEMAGAVCTQTCVVNHVLCVLGACRSYIVKGCYCLWYQITSARWFLMYALFAERFGAGLTFPAIEVEGTGSKPYISKRADNQCFWWFCM